MQFSRRTLVYTFWIAVSLALSLIRPGDLAALLLVVLLQFYLSGALLARALGRFDAPHPIRRFGWVLLCAFALNVCLGGLMRWLGVPIPVYVWLLHGVMLALAFIRPPAQDVGEMWRFSWRSAPLYALMLLCCGLALYVGAQRGGFRFNGFEDQTVFVSLADWLAHHPDEPHLLDRRIGVINGDARWLTDGWTYTHAAWVWSSGYPAANLIWYALTPLFIWTIPLAVFALAYEVTRRETAAAWSTAALVIAGLLTLDSLVYQPTALAFGQFSLFQVNSLRTMSTALVTPLALMAALAYLRAPSWRLALLVFLAGLALASMHPRQIVIFLYSAGGTALLWWLAKPERQRLFQAGALLLVLVSLLGLPLLQRLQRPFNAAEMVQFDEVEAESDDPRGEFLILTDVPVLGTTFIVSPETIFYHPLIGVVTAFGLIWIIGWRRSLAAQYIAASTLLTLILLFTPGLTPVFARFVSSVLTPGMIFGLPVALALGLTIDALLRWRAAQLAGVIFAALLMLALLFEPFPIPSSARDQMRASNLMQEIRDIRPWDHDLLAALAAILPTDRRSVVLSPEPGANYLIESLPNTFITGGRASRNYAAAGSRRFFTQSSPAAPWLDTIDLEFMAEWGVTHIIVEADDTRLPQLTLQPERFEQMGNAAGFIIFRVREGIVPDESDILFARMNALYAAQNIRRWGDDGFDLTQPGSSDGWQEIDAAWKRQPDGAVKRLALAFTALMMGEDRAALAAWDTLRADDPAVPLFTEAAAQLEDALGDPAVGAALLLAALESDQASARVLAAKTLLNDRFYYLLDEAALGSVLAVTENDAVTWSQLAEFDAYDSVRRRIVLMLSRQQWDAAARWSAQIPAVEVDPRDLLTRASIRLVQGDMRGALAILETALDTDYNAANIHLHPDRWVENVAAQAYHALLNAPPDSGISPQRIAEAGALYVMDANAVESDGAVSVTATYGSPHLAPYPVQRWRIQIASPDASQFYAELDVPAAIPPAALVRVPLTLEIDDDIPALTPARVFIEPRYDNRVTFGRTALDIVLNRPDGAIPPPDAETASYQFGETITLANFTADVTDYGLTLTLYWSAAAPPPENYQVFVHVVNEAGEIVSQRDSAPVDGRYPTSQWRIDTLIEDVHRLPFSAPLSSGDYRVMVGVYRLPDGVRLPITPPDERVQNDSLTLMTFR